MLYVLTNGGTATQLVEGVMQDIHAKRKSNVNVSNCNWVRVMWPGLSCTISI